jgi:O-glycosyl hydrolase
MRRGKDAHTLSNPSPWRRTFEHGAVESLESRFLLSVTVAINTAQQYQKIVGFGTALGIDPPLYESAAYQKMYYQDLGSSTLRVDLRLDALEGPEHQIWSPVTLGPDLQADINLFDFQQPDVQSDGQLAAAAKTYGLDSNQVFAVVTTPPHWMKGPEVNWYDGTPDGTSPTIQYGGTDSAGGSIVDTPDNLRQFGLYLAAYIKGFEQNFGVTFSAISLQNELAFSEPYDSSVYSPQLYVDTLKAVHQVFVQYGIKTQIIGPDDVGVGFTDDPWILWRQMQYINAVRADPEAMADLSAYSIHGLAGEQAINTSRSPEMWGEYMNGRSATDYPAPYGAWWTGIADDGKPSWETENTTYPQTWDGAFTMAESIQDALVIGNVSEWTYWQTSDGGPASEQTLTSPAGDITQKFAAAQQFFRYVRPDSYRVAATPSDPYGVYVSAFVQNQEHTLTSVLINAGTTDQTVNLSVAGVNVSLFDVDRVTTATQNFADSGPVPVVNGIATITLPAGSIVTLQGATAPRIDRATQGSWNGAYGADGYVVFGGSSNLPSYAQVAASGEQECTWDPTPTDPRATQDPASPSGRIASCDYSGSSYSIDLNLTDGHTHQVALYLLDWDRLNRAETVQVTDAASGAVLENASVSNFADGQWLVWNLSGHVTITISNAPGSWNAVASGLFFDPASGAQPATAAFVKSDGTTGGEWSGLYGADGYSIVSGSTSLPSYARTSTIGASTCTWANISDFAQATRPSPGVTTGVAACDYSGGTFSINLNLLDGKPHQVAAYLLDWDQQGRTETVQVTDSDTGALLDTRTVSNFTSGDWLVWNLSGRVTITFTRVSGPNAVVSALMFDPVAPPPAAPASAQFVKSDATTSGHWTGAYGADGYSVVSGQASLPRYATLATHGATVCTWATSTTDARDLQVAPGSNNLVAACDYSSGSFALDLNLADGKSHQVTAYLLDWDRLGRAETVQVRDADSGQILDTRSVAGFGQGEYLTWNLSGHVTITVVNNPGSWNAVLAGLFFDPASAAPASTATFTAQDASTGGTWTGIYGADGYSIPGATASLPSYASLSTSDAQQCVWAPSATESRDLQTAPGASTRIASCDYSASSFTLDLNLTDGKAHQVALYCLDWDHLGRSQSIQVTDAATGTILDTRSLSNFGSGQYLAWTLSGHVKITISNNPGSWNAVLGGIFFG